MPSWNYGSFSISWCSGLELDVFSSAISRRTLNLYVQNERLIYGNKSIPIPSNKSTPYEPHRR